MTVTELINFILIQLSLFWYDVLWRFFLYLKRLSVLTMKSYIPYVHVIFAKNATKTPELVYDMKKRFSQAYNSKRNSGWVNLRNFRRTVPWYGMVRYGPNEPVKELLRCMVMISYTHFFITYTTLAVWRVYVLFDSGLIL